LIIGGCFFANAAITNLTPVLIGVRIFVTAAMGLIVAGVVLGRGVGKRGDSETGIGETANKS